MSLTLRFPKYHGHELAYNAISIIVSNTTSIQIYIKYIYTIIRYMLRLPWLVPKRCCMYNVCISNTNRMHCPFSTQNAFHDSLSVVQGVYQILIRRDYDTTQDCARKTLFKGKKSIASYDTNKPLFILFVIEIDINDIKWNRIIIDSSFIITQDWDD